jgi:hypothetical protein
MHRDQALPRTFKTLKLDLKEGYWLVNWAGCAWNTPAPDTCEAIKKAATTAGTLISLRN